MRSLIISAKYAEGVGHISNHFHDCSQLIYVVGGKATVQVGEKHYEALPGTLVLLSRFERHSVVADGEDYKRYTLRISPDTHGYAAFPGEKLLFVLINRPENFCHALPMPGITCLMEQIVRETEAEGEMQHKMLDILLFQLLILLCREHPWLLTQEDGNLSAVLQVEQYLEAGYARRIALEELAKHFHMSQSYLSHLFKRVTGHSVMGYLKACRIAAAKRMLAETEAPVSQIVDDCGFTDNSNFSRTFKEETGLSPSAFRQRYRK